VIGSSGDRVIGEPQPLSVNQNIYESQGNANRSYFAKGSNALMISGDHNTGAFSPVLSVLEASIAAAL